MLSNEKGLFHDNNNNNNMLQRVGKSTTYFRFLYAVLMSVLVNLMFIGPCIILIVE